MQLCRDRSCATYTGYIIICALLFACVEIEIEGKHGWAEKLPTARLGDSKTSLTTYHILFFIVVFTFMHFPYIVQPSAWTWQNESFTLCMLFAFFLLEDIYWFALNPHYGLHKIADAWWHPTCHNIPTTYVLLGGLFVVFAMLSGYKTKVFHVVGLLMISIVLVACLVAPLYKKMYLCMHPPKKKYKSNGEKGQDL